MAQVNTHPTAQALALFGHGKLPEAQAATVAAHLETCADCRNAVAGLPPDSFMGKVRAAKPGSPTNSPSVVPSPAGAATSPSKPVAPPADIPPELANHSKFRIVRELGRGGMGVIYQAEHRVLEKFVALKVISPAVLDNPAVLERFHAEARAAAKLDHPNIARAYDADQAGSLHFLVMEFVEGTDLARLVEKKGPLPVANACHYIRQAALGLQHASEKGMVHRDIKPHNLMVAPKGVVKILDFGLARLRSEQRGKPGLTQADAFMGTPEYVAPEQAQDAREADTRADIYSLGCTLYALLTGRPPFVGETAVQLILAHIEKEPQPLHELRQDASAELSAVVAKMLAKDPSQRYQRPAEVAQALEPFIKAAAKPGAAGAAPVPPRVAAAGTGTRVGGDTSRETGRGPALSKRPAQAVATGAGEKKGSPSAAPVPSPAPSKAKQKQKETRPTPAAWWKRPTVLAGAGVGVLLLALVGLWAAVHFRMILADGSILVLEVNEANPDVFVNGQKVEVIWGEGGKKAEISLKPGTHTLEVKKDGFTVYGEEVEIKDGKRSVLTARLNPVPQKLPREIQEPPQNVTSATDKGGSASPTLETLRRDRIAPEALKLAGDGDPNKAPASLVGVLGEVQPVHSEAVLGLAYSPDGLWLASGSVDKTIMLRDSATGEVKRTLKGHTGAVSAVAFSKDSKSLVSASHDGTIKLWPVEKEEEPKTLLPELGRILTMAASPDGRFLAAGAADRAIKLWKWGQWDKPLELPALKGKVTSLTFSPDGALLASSWEGCVRLYQTSDGKMTQTWPFDTSNYVLAFHRDGKRLVTTGEWVKTWDVASGQQLAKSVNEATHSNMLAVHPDGELVYHCVGGGLCAYMLELTTLKRASGKGTNYFREPQGICSAVYSPDGEFLALGTNNGGVHVWDFSKGEKQLPKQGHSHYITTLSVSPDGLTVLSGGDDSAVRRWEIARPRESKLMDKAEFILHHVAYSPDGKKFVTSASFGGDTRDMGIVWDAVTGKRLFVVNPTVYVRYPVFSPDGKTIAGCGQGGTECIVLWDADTGKQLHRFTKMGVCLDQPAFSRDGKRVAAATTDTKCVKVWDVASGEEVASWTDDKPMCAVAFSPDGDLVAAGHHDGTVSLWDLAEHGKKKRTWEGHAANIIRLKFTPDGKTLVSSSSDGTIRVWSPAQQRAREIIALGPANRPLTFDLDPSGTYLFAAGQTPVIFVLRLPKPEAQSVAPSGARAEPTKTILDQWFAVGTRWEGKAGYTNASPVYAWWFTVLSREGKKFKGRLVLQDRSDWTIDGTLEDDGTLFHWTSARHTPNAWMPEQPTDWLKKCEGKCGAERIRMDWRLKLSDGVEREGHTEFTVRKAGPRKDDDEGWPPPLHPRLAAIPAGKWSVHDGELVQEEFVKDTSKPMPSIVFGDLAWKDYDFHVKAKRTAGDHGFVVVFDQLRATKHTEWAIGFPESREMYLQNAEMLPTGLKLTPLSAHKAVAIATNQWRDILIKARGQWVECFLDGKSVFKIAHPDRCGGKLGFICWRMAARYKDIWVKAPDGKTVLWEGSPELP